MYREALRVEDYTYAGELGDRAGVGLLGWWWPQNTNCDNPSHLMRVSAALDRYVFEVFTPDDIARIHVCPHPLHTLRVGKVAPSPPPPSTPLPFSSPEGAPSSHRYAQGRPQQANC